MSLLKNTLRLIVLLFLILGLVACQQDSKGALEQPITSEKRMENEKFEKVKDITDEEQIKELKTTLEQAKWEGKIVNMGHPSEYRLSFNMKMSADEIQKVFYDIWISPKGKKLELVDERNHQYVQLSEQDSQKLYKILTDEELVMVKVKG